MEKNSQVIDKTVRKIKGSKRGRMRTMGARNRTGGGGDPGIHMNGRISPKMSIRQVDEAKKMKEPDWNDPKICLDDLYQAENQATHRMSGGEWTKWEAVRGRIQKAIRKREHERVEHGGSF